MLVTLNDVFFGTALTRIAPGASRTLDMVVDVLKKNPDQRIIVEGHTDSTGAADFNQALSEQRAAAVKEALVARGIDGGRIDTRGYGESRPVASDANEGGRQLNRRVELVFPET
jgi:outer membrane protein OmpA-like peptidoglycan-associated protein